MLEGALTPGGRHFVRWLRFAWEIIARLSFDEYEIGLMAPNVQPAL
jgi:hypothetical protein